jgi:hypothetical protein
LHENLLDEENIFEIDEELICEFIEMSNNNENKNNKSLPTDVKNKINKF